MCAQQQPQQNPLWDDVREQLRGVLGEAFDRWFALVTGSIDEAKDGTFVLQLVAPDGFQRDWIKDNYSSIIEALWRKITPVGNVMFAVKEKQKQTETPVERLPAKVIHFPLPFPIDTRPASNDFLRCALFAAIQGKDRQHFRDFVRLESFGDVEVWMKGDQLNQDDQDVFMQLVFMAQHTPLGEDTHVSFRSLVTGLGKGYGSNARESAAQSFIRLVASTIKIISKGGGMSYIGHLVNDGFLPSDRTDLPRLERDLTYHLNPKLVPYFAQSAFTLIDWKQRLKIIRQDLARWLHLWLASNAEYYPTKVETIRDKCGSQTAELWKFRQMLCRALKSLENKNIIGSWYIDQPTDLVHIETKPSPSQQKHLAKSKKHQK